MRQNYRVIITLICVCFFTNSVHAQMQKNDDVGVTYDQCTKNCQGLGNSEQILECIRGCRYVSTGATKVNKALLANAQSLVPEINKRSSTESEHLIHTDIQKKSKIYAQLKNGKIVGYYSKNEAGVIAPLELTTIQKKTRRCYIFIGGKLYEVTCPDVIIETNTKHK